MRRIYDVIINTRFVQKLPWISRSEVSALKEKMHLLATVPIFSYLSRKELSYIYSITQEISYKSGDLVFQVGSSRSALYIIKSGKIAIESSEDKECYAVLGEGDYFGEISLADIGLSQNYNSTCRCLEESKFLVVDKESFDRLKKQELSIANKVLVRLSFVIGNKFVDTKQELQNEMKSNKILIDKLNGNGVINEQ